MDLFTAVILGAIQGVVEWLPVSSEAAISLFMTQVLGRQPVESVNTAVFLHTGTMLAAFIYFRSEFIEIILEIPEYLENAVGERRPPEEHSLINYLLISTLFTGLIGGFLYLFGLKYLPGNPSIFAVLVGFALLVTGGLKLYGSGSNRKYTETGLADSTFVGLLQGLAIIPGISRSGTTVFALFHRDFSGEDAFKLSFLMSVPAVLVAQVGLGIFSGFQVTKSLLISASVSFVIGYLSIDLILELAEKVEVAYICFVLAFLSFLTALI